MSTLREGRRPELILVGLLIALAVPQLPFRSLLGLEQTIGARLALEAIWWAIAAGLLAWVIIIERRPLASIGIRVPTFSTLGWALIGTVAGIATFMLSYALILPALGLEINQSATSKITSLPIGVQLAIFLRAGVVEELLYRGYSIERLQELTGSKWLAALIPGLVFIAGHFAFWGSGQLIVVGFGTIVMTLLYMWRRDLLCCMIAHASIDLIGFTLARLQS